MINKVHGGDIKHYYENSPHKKSEIIDFSVNINPLGLSPKVREAITKNIADVMHYPELDSRSLKRALGNFHGIDQDNLAVGNGSIELIYLIPRALKVRKILIITPTFSEYEFAARPDAAKILFFGTKEKDNFRINPDEIRKYLSWAELIFLCNPTNPTGGSISAGDLSAIVKLCSKHKTILAMDEAFIDFVDLREAGSLISVAAKRRGLLVIRSLTKFFAIPGLRLGYVAGSRYLVRKISCLQYPWNVNSLAQIAGEEVISDVDYMKKSRKYILEEKRYLFNRLKNVRRIKVFPSSSNFILCKLEGSNIESAAILNKRLIKKQILVRDCGNFRGLNKRFFRVAVRQRMENLKLISALKGVL